MPKQDKPKFETKEVVFSDWRCSTFKDPARFYYVNGEGNRVYILKCADRLKAQQFVDSLYSPNFFIVRTDKMRDDAKLHKQKLIKQNKPEEFKPVFGTATRKGQKKF